MSNVLQHDADPTIARLREIRRIVDSLRVDPALKDYDDRWEAIKLLDEAIRIAQRKHHLVRKLSCALRAKNRRMARYVGRVKP